LVAALLTAPLREASARDYAAASPMPEHEYILFCDESDRDGAYFSNFYGGLLVGASQYQPVTDRLNSVKLRENLLAEVKWQKVTETYLPKYEALINSFFDEIAGGLVKVRIMFRQNAQKPVGLSDEQREMGYWLLYYQFVKHAFGFAMIPQPEHGAHLRIYFDRFPDTGEQAARFKGFIEALEQSRGFRAVNLRIRKQDITEVDSHDHALLQCLDVVLGAICFRLNDKHLAKPPGKTRRGSRTVAKEKLYNLIRQRIQQLKPHFNIGITTGGGPASRWELPYAHWEFTPAEFDYDKAKTKRGEKKNPAGPT
jgi:hypothetical protein